MATFEKLKNGRVRVGIRINGIRESKTLDTQKKAQSWARDRESELSKRDSVNDDKVTFADLFQRYAAEVSSTKRGAHWEQIRLNMFLNKFPDLCAIKLVRAKREDIEDWMDERIKTVKPSTINRELNLISHALRKAQKWRWISHHPMEGLERPKNPPPRDRRISPQEIQTLCTVLGYREGRTPELKREFASVAFLFAIETAMRANEICTLTRSNINLQEATALLTKTKNGDERCVPLSKKAIRILENLPKTPDDNTPVFQLTSRTLSTIFRTHRIKAAIDNLTFHDTRHEATTRLAGKLHVLDLARVTGHRNINELLTYYNKSAADIAMELEEEPITNKTQENTNGNNISYLKLAEQMLEKMKSLTDNS